MKSLTYVEIDVDHCSLVYGVAPCEAVLGVTGDRKCFNSVSTCQDRLHFDDEGATLRFAMNAAYLPIEIDAIPSVLSVSVTPAIVSLGESLGQRASIKVTFKDHPHSDTGPGHDPYLEDRDYDPYKRGTFWGKFRARHPFLRGRALRLIRGHVGQSLEEMSVEHYVIESFDGPTANGSFTITGKDLLKFADGDRAQAPKLSQGYLLIGIDEAATAFTTTPAGTGDLYPLSGLVAVGGTEIMSYTRVADTFTVVRAQEGTVAVEHDAQDRIQECLQFISEDPADIINVLLTEYAGVDPAVIPLVDWLNETASFLRRTYTSTIAEPTNVSTLLSELIQQAALVLWWDVKSATVKLRVLKGIDTDSLLMGDDLRIEESLSSVEQPDKRVSQIWTYFGKINPLEGQDDPQNYRSAALTVDLQAETDYGLPAIKKIFSRWIPAFGRSIAVRVNQLQLGRYSTPPRRFSFKAGIDTDLFPVAGYQLESWGLQDQTGQRVIVPIQITRIGYEPDHIAVEAEELLFVQYDEEDLDIHTIVIDTQAGNINLREVHDRLYPDPITGDQVDVYIEFGVYIYSSYSTVPSFIVGSWPVGVTINIYHRGSILGAGGRGGAGRDFGSDPLGGLAGGTAFYTRYPINLILDAGIINGGGGGGGGGNTNTFGAADDRGGGGGGGAGFLGGLGGIGPGEGENGQTAELFSGGQGGRAWSTLNWWDTSNYYIDVRGGLGGGPGSVGLSGQGYGGSFGAAGGAAGYAIDGVSYITISGTGTRTGPEVN